MLCEPGILNLKCKLSRVDKYLITLDAVVESIYIQEEDLHTFIRKKHPQPLTGGYNNTYSLRLQWLPNNTKINEHYSLPEI